MHDIFELQSRLMEAVHPQIETERRAIEAMSAPMELQRRLEEASNPYIELQGRATEAMCPQIEVERRAIEAIAAGYAPIPPDPRYAPIPPDPRYAPIPPDPQCAPIPPDPRYAPIPPDPRCAPIPPDPLSVHGITDLIGHDPRLAASAVNPLGTNLELERLVHPHGRELEIAERMANPLRHHLGLADSIGLGELGEYRPQFTMPPTLQIAGIAYTHDETLREVRELRDEVDELKRDLFGGETDENAPEEEPLYGSDGVKRSPGF